MEASTWAGKKRRNRRVMRILSDDVIECERADFGNDEVVYEYRGDLTREWNAFRMWCSVIEIHRYFRGALDLEDQATQELREDPGSQAWKY